MADIIDRLITRIEFVGVSDAINVFRNLEDRMAAFRNLQGPGITNWDRLSVALAGTGRALGFIGGVAALQAAAGAVKVSVEFDRLQRQLEVLYGSSAQAQRAFDWIVQFANSTPFSVDELTTAFVRLGTLGIQPTARNLKVFAGTAQMVHRDVEDIVKAVGFGALGNFARLRYLGISRQAVAANAAPGVIPTNGPITNQAAATEAIIRTLEKKFGGAYNNFSNSPGAAISNFQDAIQRLGYTLAGGRTAAEGVTNAFKALTFVVNFITAGFLLLRGGVELFTFGIVKGLSLFMNVIDSLIQKAPDWLIGKPVKAGSTTIRTFLDAFSGISFRNMQQTAKELRSIGTPGVGNPPKIPGLNGNYGTGEDVATRIIKEVIGGGFISKIGVAPSELPGLQREFNSKAPRTVRIEGSEGEPLYRAVEDIVNKVNYKAFRMGIP